MSLPKPETFLRSALLYSVLLMVFGLVLLFTLFDLGRNQMPFKERADALPHQMVALHLAAVQVMSEDTKSNDFYQGEPTYFLQEYDRQEKALEAALRHTIDHPILRNQWDAQADLNKALAAMLPHNLHFYGIVNKLRLRGNDTQGYIGDLTMATEKLLVVANTLESKNLLSHVLELEKYASKYLLHGDEEDYVKALEQMNMLESMNDYTMEPGFDQALYRVALVNYQDAFRVIIDIDNQIGLIGEEGELDVLEHMKVDLETSMKTAGSALTKVIDTRITTSLYIVIGALIMMLLVGVTFVLQNRTLVATELAKQQTEATLERVSYYDAVTGLPNQKKFLDLVEAKSSQIQMDGLMFVIGFKDYNTVLSAYGQDGVQFLQVEVSARLQDHCEGCIIASLEHGQFAVYKSQIQQVYQEVTTIEGLLKDLNAPYQNLDQHYYTDHAVGICLYPYDGDLMAGLIEKAKVAFDTAVKQSKSDLALYNSAYAQATKERLDDIATFKNAIQDQAFFMVYQPLVDTHSKGLVAAEALVRWQKTDGSLVSPGNFIPLAEETGLILPLSHLIIDMVFKQSAKWRMMGKPLRLSVNLSAVQFSDTDLVGDLAALLKKSGALATDLALELTEYSLLDGSSKTLETLHTLKNMGFTLYLDDFGTGYSSLSYIKQLPVDVLKVDRAFIKDYPGDQDTSILEAVKGLSQQFKMKVVVEGIETQDQDALITRLGCDYGQGYLYSKPIGADEFENEWLNL